MKIIKKHDLRLLILLVVALALIGMNSIRIVEKFKPNKNDSAYVNSMPLDPSSFYNAEIVQLYLVSELEDTLKIPDSNNHLIFGLNNNFAKYYIEVTGFFSMLDLSKYDIDIVLVSLVKYNMSSVEFPIYQYNPELFGEYFHISDLINFTLLIDESNQIKYFDYKIISGMYCFF